MADHIEEQFAGRWQPSTPEPYWFRRWFRWVPGCYACSLRALTKVTFRDRDEWVRHYWQQHAGGAT